MDTEKHPLGAQKILILSGGSGMRRIVAIVVINSEDGTIWYGWKK